jgi:polyketide cyclase/dehydrase/lipid transport protein
MNMRQAVTRTVAIEASASRVLSYIARPENFPEWCRAMNRSGAHDDDAGSAFQSGPRVAYSHDPFWASVDGDHGTVDYFFRTSAGLEVASARVIPVDGGAQVVLTVFAPPKECRDCGSLEERIAAAEAELAILKAFLERSVEPVSSKDDVWH